MRTLQSLAFLLLVPAAAHSQALGLSLVRDINPGLLPKGQAGEAQPIAAMNGVVYLQGTDRAHGIELWRATAPPRAPTCSAGQAARRAGRDPARRRRGPAPPALADPEIKGRELMRNHLKHCAATAIRVGEGEAEAMYDELIDDYRHK